MAKPSDPLDVVMGVLATVILICVGGSFMGHGTKMWGSFSVLLLTAYFMAPSRKFPTADEVTAGLDLSGKVAIVTGPTSGIGVETARTLAFRGAHVILAARSLKKLEETKKDIEEDLAKRSSSAQLLGNAPGRLTILELDLNDLKSVRNMVKAFEALQLPLHMLINNAGIMALPSREVTVQGIEKQMGVCHIAHFLLTKLLLPHLEKSAPSRVVSLSSMGHLRYDKDFLQDPNLESKEYDQWKAYGNAKLSNMLFAKELHKRYSPKGVSAFSLHPGGIHTGLQGHVDAWTMFKWRVVTPFFFKSTQQGAATTIKCATEKGVETDGGKYFDDCKATAVTEKLEEKIGSDAASKLWEMSEALLDRLKA